jgi:DNA-binding response OmpR family regulator
VAKILVADDDPDILELVQTFLEMAGHDVVGAADGLSAYEALSSGTFEVSVLDNLMPGMTGPEVVAACQTLEPRPVLVLLSALASRQDIRDGYRAGADDYISKPFARQELVERIAMLLDEQRFAHGCVDAE